MPTFNVYTTTGELNGTVEIPDMFSLPVDQKLIHRYMVWVRSVLRPTLASTKTRGEVRGGGKKPWKQKGTGRARIGSTRAPHWRKGGIVFGPTTDRNWATRMPRAERRKALFSALSAKATSESVLILDTWELSAPRTKDVLTVLNALPTKGSKVLYVQQEHNEALGKSFANLPKATYKTVSAMNILDVLNADTIVMTKSGLEGFQQHFTPTL